MKTVRIIAGPTASGKSAKAIELAKKENGVIINCDSIQIYDDLPLLTAQPSTEEMADAPHKLYGCLHPNDSSSAGDWRGMATPLIENALENDQTPIVVGGSGLYIKALMEGLSPMPVVPPEIRAETEALYKELGIPGFHDALKKRDPVMAQRFHPHHKARLIRAWEVLEATGKSLSEWQKEKRIGPPADWHFDVLKIIPDRPDLRERCHIRFLKMLENGALDEVQAFRNRIEQHEVSPDAPLTKALGFKVLCDYIDGNISRERAIELAVTQTRQYAKRQVTWFRNQL